MLSVDLSSLVIRPPTMTMKLNQKSAAVVTSFFSNKIFDKRRALQGSAGILTSVKAAVAAFEDLQAARLPL